MSKRKQLSEAQEEELLDDLISNASLDRGESLNASDFNFDAGIGDDNWDKVLNYVIANKELGLKKIGENLLTKYSMTAKVKKEIAKSL